jgi:Ca2+-binding EF-hand superfamily protein
MEGSLKVNELQLTKISSKLLSAASQNKVKSEKTVTNGEPLPNQKKYKRKEKQLTAEQVEVFKQAFEIFDVDHSGNIDREELSSLLNALGFNYNEAQTTRIFDEVDSDHSGVIEINEFISFMSKQIVTPPHSAGHGQPQGADPQGVSAFR